MTQRENFISGQETRRRFRHFLFFLRLSGLPILPFKLPKFYIFYSYLILICFVVSTVSVFMNFFVTIEDLERNMETARLVIPYAMIMGMYFFVRFRINDVGRLLSLTKPFTWDDLPSRDPETDSSTMAAWVPRIELFSRRFTYTIMIYTCLDSIIRMLSMKDRQFVLHTWYPFDATVSPVYEFIIFSQICASMVYIFFLFGFNGLYAFLVSITCAQLEKIRYNILKIGKEVPTLAIDSAADSGRQNGEELYQHMKKQLNGCIHDHQYILSYMNTMEDTLNPLLVGVFLLQLISMCLSAFSIVTSWGNHAQAVQGVVVYTALIILQANYCWFGSQLSFQADRVREAAFGSNWIGAPIPFQRSITIILTRANVEFCFTAGKFVPVNITTMMNMVSQSVSYFMFLLEVKDSIDKTINIESN